MKSLILVILVNLIVIINSARLPVVLWHGMGDTCCFPFSLGSFKKFLESELGVYVKSLEIGNSIFTDYKSGYLIHPNKQVKDVCDQLANDQNLTDGYNAIGFSQGGQFLRAIAQRCPEPKMNNLITLGGQHQGVFGLPFCPSLSYKTCEYFRELLNYAAYEKWVQNYLVQATYWHDPLNEDTYKNYSTFLADINNELVRNEDYITNLQKLNKFIMVRFNNDTIVQPIESQWFGFYKPGQDVETLTMEETELYLEDKLGLKQMMENDKIIFLECDGDHLQFSRKWFKDNVMPYLQ